MKNLEITTVCQSESRLTMWGFIDAPFKSDKSMQLFHDWEDIHCGVLSLKERNEVVIGSLVFNGESHKRSFMAKYNSYEITNFHGIPGCALAKYEQVIYEPIVSEWYEMYQHVIVAGQLLPSILYDGNLYGNDDPAIDKKLQQLKEITGWLYNEIDNKQAFLTHMSTVHIKNTLMVHPTTALMQCADEQHRLELFRHQLFKDEEREVSK